MNNITSGAAFLYAAARIYFSAFLGLAFGHINGGAALADNWHLHAMARELNLVAKGKVRRLLITMPPRNLKSITVTVAWVTFMLGINPSLNIVCVSYSNDLAAKFARDRLAIMQSWWYRKIFPKTVINRVAAMDIQTTMGGGCMATSLTGTFTGRGADIVIIDDPQKPEEAMSPVQRESVESWYRSTLLSRLNDKQTGAIILVMQRVHQYDLAGIVIEEGNWRELSLPAIATENRTYALPLGERHERKVGDALHPSREPIDVLERMRTAMGSYIFSAQYQQAPVPIEGNIVKAEWLQFYDAPYRYQSGDQIVISLDTASKDGIHNDWSVGVTAAIRNQSLLIIDVFRKKLQFPDLVREVTLLSQKFCAETILIEDAASGTQLLQQLRRHPAPGVPRPIGRSPEMDKVSRLYGKSSYIESGQVLLPSEAPWLATFVEELLAFPGGRHDDQVDALAQLLSWFSATFAGYDDGPGEPPIMGDPYFRFSEDDDPYGIYGGDDDDDDPEE